LAVIAWLMLVKTVFFVVFFGKPWLMQRFLDVIGNILVVVGKTQWFCLILNDRMVG